MFRKLGHTLALTILILSAATFLVAPSAEAQTVNDHVYFNTIIGGSFAGNTTYYPTVSAWSSAYNPPMGMAVNIWGCDAGGTPKIERIGKSWSFVNGGLWYTGQVIDVGAGASGQCGFVLAFANGT